MISQPKPCNQAIFDLTPLRRYPIHQQFASFWNLWQKQPLWPNREELTAALKNSSQKKYGGPLNLRFTPPIVTGKRLRKRLRQENPEKLHERMHESRYESQIMEYQSIPCHESNWHDFMNAAVWTMFPKTKHTLHRLAYEHYLKFHRGNLEKDPGGNARDQILDRLTCFDEGGLILLVRPSQQREASAILSSHDISFKTDWLRKHRPPVVIFGHGIWENLIFHHTNLHAYTLMISLDQDDGAREIWPFPEIEELDDLFAQHIAIELHRAAAGHAGSLPLAEVIDQNHWTRVSI